MRSSSTRHRSSGSKWSREADGRVRFNIDLRTVDYAHVTRLATITGTNCLIVVRTLVDHVTRNRQDLDFIAPFELSLIGERVCTLEVKAPPRVAQQWKALGMFYGLMGRRGFCTWALEGLFHSLSDKELGAIIAERADLKEAIELCLNLKD